MVSLTNASGPPIPEARLRKMDSAIVLDDYLRSRLRDCLLEDKVEQVPVGLPMIGRIHEYEIGAISLASEKAERRKDGFANQPIAGRDATNLQVLPDEPGRLDLRFHEYHLPSPPADRLQADGTGPREGVKKRRFCDTRSQHTKERLAQPVTRRSDLQSLRCLQPFSP